MRVYWAIVLKKAQKLYNAGVRGMVVEAHHSSQGERVRGWTAWGPAGLPADWKELGLKEALADMARVMEPEMSGVSYLWCPGSFGRPWKGGEGNPLRRRKKGVKIHGEGARARDPR